MSGIHAAGYSDNLFYDDCAYNQRLKRIENLHNINYIKVHMKTLGNVNMIDSIILTI